MNAVIAHCADVESTVILVLPFCRITYIHIWQFLRSSFKAMYASFTIRELLYLNPIDISINIGKNENDDIKEIYSSHRIQKGHY